MNQSTSSFTTSPKETQPPLSAVPGRSSNKQERACKTKALRASSADAYQKDVRLFEQSGGVVPCEALALQKYIWSMRNKLAPTSQYRRCMAVRHAHYVMGQKSPTDDPLLRPLLRALQRGYIPDKTILQAGAPVPGETRAKSREPKPSLPITRRLLGQILLPLPRSSIDRRDRALLLLGFAAALKRGALVAINVGDLRFTADALILQIRETGQEAVAEIPLIGTNGGVRVARQIAIPITGGDLCAASAIRDYLLKSALDTEPPEAPLFRACDRGGDPTRNRLESAVVSLVVKKWIAAAGIDAKPYSAQSLVTGRRGEFAKGLL